MSDAAASARMLQLGAVQVRLRAITEADLPFLQHLYATTRHDELAAVPWSDQEKANFLGQQFEAQHRHYMEHFPDSAFDLLMIEEQPAGRLYLQQRKDEIRVIDIALLPEHRGQGLGGQLMRWVLAKGERQGLPVRIHVEQFNPALRLYERLGFERIEDQGPYFLMQWSPGSELAQTSEDAQEPAPLAGGES